MQKLKFLFLILTITLFFNDWICNSAHAQGSDFGVAYGVIINSENQSAPVDGQIVSINQGEYRLSNQEYDPNMYGVVDLSPDILLDLTGGSNGVPIVTSGQAYVLVSSSGGGIKIGDWLTSSTEYGVAIKAVRDNGTVIGQALEPFPANSREPGLILATINIVAPAGTGNSLTPSLSSAFNQFLVDLFGLYSNVTQEKAYDLLRYIIAAIVIIISIIFSYYTFGRIARSGIEAVGRNPLAKNSILFGISFNIGIAAVIIISGILVAYMIIRL